MELINRMTALSDKVWQKPDYFIAFGFGSGLSPKAPGTFGTLAAIPFYLWMSSYSWPVYLILTIIAGFIGTYVSDRVCRDLGVHDYKGVVCDEFVGYFLTMFLAPKGMVWVILGFVLFRLFDIWKPQPIRWFDERIHGGFGVMLDDILAAIPAWLILHLIAYWWK